MDEIIIYIIAVYVLGMFWNIFMMWKWRKNSYCSGIGDYVACAIFILSSWLFWLVCGGSWAFYFIIKVWVWLVKKISRE